MKAHEWQRLAAETLGHSREWRFRGKLAYQVPYQHFVRGVLLGDSSVAGRVYLWRITMSLFPARSDLVRLGMPRFGSFDREDRGSIIEALRAASRAWPSEEASLRALVADARRHDLRSIEQAAYASLVLGDTAGFQRSLAVARKQAGPLRWESTVLEELNQVEQLVDRGGLLAAQQHLDALAIRGARTMGLASPSGLTGAAPRETR